MEPRPIKFRAWNKETSVMVDLQKITPLALAIIPIMAGAGFGVYVPDDPRLIIMQFAGLVDRNGKEIYEGDILQGDDGTTATIIFGDGSFCVDEKGAFAPWILGNHSQYWQVIGNVYQNPDLLDTEEKHLLTDADATAIEIAGDLEEGLCR